MVGNNLWHKKLILHFSLMAGVILSMFPFYWLVVMSTRTSSDMFKFPPKMTIGSNLMHNVRNVLDNINFFQGFLNTLFVATIATIAVLFFCSLAGFAFAKFEFPGKKWLFILLLSTMMIPMQLGLVPQFIIMQELGWIGTFKALIIPGMANAFGIFWIRQYAQGAIPFELLEAGRIDGCSTFRLYWNIVLPIIRPALAFLGIFNFMNVWNDYLWPLIILTDAKKHTLMIVLSQLNGIYNTDYAMVMAGTLMATIPLLLMFLVVSRQFIADIAAGAVKD